MLHFSLYKMTNYRREYLTDFGVGHQRNLFNHLVVVFDKTKMLDDITLTFPSREIPGFDNQPVEVAVTLDKRVNLTGNCGEVLF